MNTVYAVLYIIVAYLIGSIPSGVWYSKLLHRIDVRTLGSGNSGGTNVGRNFGFQAAVIVIAIDVLKGWIPMALVGHLFPDQHLVIMLTAIAIVLGHSYPIWAGFRGGKIVATSIGVLLGFNFGIAITEIVLFFVLLFFSSMVSLSAMIAFNIAAIAILFISPHWEYKIGFILIGLFLLYRHRENISRLLKGEESRISWGLNKPKDK